MKRLRLFAATLTSTALLAGMALGAKSLYQRLTSPDPEERDQAQEEVLVQRDLLVDLLVRVLNQEGDDQEQWRQEHTQVQTAVRILGELRHPSAVDPLVKHLNTGRHAGEGFASPWSPSDWGPNAPASALIKIGKPSVAPVVKVLRDTTDTEIARQCALVIREIEGREVGRFILEKAIEKADDWEERAHLERALPYFRP